MTAQKVSPLTPVKLSIQVQEMMKLIDFLRRFLLPMVQIGLFRKFLCWKADTDIRVRDLRWKRKRGIFEQSLRCRLFWYGLSLG